jgi:phenylacetate-coenzyme A ligase PaaK-like adenylate-forming protein
VHASSGTTGQPTVVGYTRDDLRTWASLMARSIRASGGRPGDRVHVAYGYGLFTGGLGAHYGAEELGCTVIPVSGGMTERQVRLITDFEPEIIMVTPSYMLAIVDEMERQGVDPRGTSLQVGIFGAEPWTQDLRREIEDRLDMHALDIYGLSEVMGPGRGQRVHRDQGRPAHLGGPLLPRDHRSADRRGAARRRGRRAGLHLADQAGHAGDPLPHPRPDPAAARHRAPDAPDGEDHRPLPTT